MDAQDVTRIITKAVEKYKAGVRVDSVFATTQTGHIRIIMQDGTRARVTIEVGDNDSTP